MVQPQTRRPLSRPECRSWLATHAEGRLGYRSGCGDRAVPVVYSLAGDEVVFRVPEYNQLLQYALGAPVTFEVAGPAEDDLAETVTVRGTTHAAAETAVPDGAVPPESWPPGVSTRLVCLPLTSVSGSLQSR